MKFNFCCIDNCFFASQFTDSDLNQRISYIINIDRSAFISVDEHRNHRPHSDFQPHGDPQLVGQLHHLLHLRGKVQAAVLRHFLQQMWRSAKR